MEPSTENTPSEPPPERMSESDRLRLENALLRRALLEHGIPLPSLESRFSAETVRISSRKVGEVNAGTAAHEKISLFRRLFRGREDVYAQRWTGRDGKSGYSPASLKDWNACDASGRPKRTFLPLTDEALQRHLTGREVVGVYPLLPDETCHFLAADFDKDGWQQDASAFVETCESWGISAALERSRSGKGGHVWVFFENAIPAVTARKLGTALLTQTMEKRHQIGLDSYDRLFPNQDTMPKGGFGNLIALPLQGGPRKEGNSVFVDGHLEPYPDQWAFLSERPLLPLAKVESVVAALERTGNVIGLREVNLDADALDEEPWLRAHSKRGSAALIEGPLPAEVRVVRGNLVYVEKTGLPSALVNRILRLAAFQNPEFYRNQAMRLSTFGKPRVIRCGEEIGQFVALPRGCFEECSSLLKAHNVLPVVQDERFQGTPLQLKFNGTLYSEQEEAVCALLPHAEGVLSATTAFGKTVVAARMIAERGVNTLVLVHRKQLLDQWRERLSLFLDVPSREIGAIGGGKKIPTKRIDVAVIQSLGRKGEVHECVGDYGHVIVDECHHLSAFSFEQVLRQVRAKYVLGLTATPIRKDGHHPIIFMQCGPIRFRVDARKHAALRPFEHVVYPCPTVFQLPPSEEPLPIQEIYRLLTENQHRNLQIIEDVVAAVREGRSPILLTERTSHADWFAAALEGRVQNIVSLKGGQGIKQRRKVAAQIAEISTGTDRVLIATGRYIGEGFDDARLDTLFLTLPVSWSGTLQQYVGRLHRLHAGKTEVRVYDYVDEAVPMLSKMYRKRIRGYTAVGYSIKDGLWRGNPSEGNELTSA